LVITSGEVARVSGTGGRQIFDGLVEYPLPVAPGVKDYVFYCGSLGAFGNEAKKLFDKHWPAHVVRTAATLQDVMSALQTEVTSSGVTQIRELVLVAHGNANQLFFPVVPAAAAVDPVYGCISAWSLAKLQDDIGGQFASFDQARKAVIPTLLDDSWVTIRACNIGNSAEALYALYSFFGGRANVYAPTQFMVFADSPIKPGNRIDSKFGVYDYLVKQHFLSSSEHTPNRQAAIVADLVDPEFFSQPFQLATAQFTGGDPAQVTAYQQLVDGLNHYAVGTDLVAAFAAGGHQLSASPQVVSANDASIDMSATPPGPCSVWYVRDTSLPDGAATVDVVYQIRDETDAGGTSTLEASAQLAVASAYPSVPFQLFFDQDDDDAFHAVIARLTGYADQGPYADQKYKDAFDAIQALLDAGTWTDSTNDIAAAVNLGLVNAGFDPLPDPLPPIQLTGDEDTWQIPTTPPLTVAVELEAAPDGSPLHAIVVRVALGPQALQDQQLGVVLSRGRVPHTPGTEIAAYLDRFTADELTGLMDYLRSAYRPAYAYYLDHALAAITRKRDFMTWVAAHPEFADDPLPAHLMLLGNENHDLTQVAFPFDFNDNWREVTQHSKYTATVQTDLFSEGSLTDKLHLTGTWVCGTLPADSRYVSREEIQVLESQGFEQYFAAQSKNVFEPQPAQVDQGCADFRAALQKWKELRDADATPDVQQQQLEELLGADGKSAWERMKQTLEPLHMGTELWDMVFDSHIEYRVFATEFAEHLSAKYIETEGLKEWLEESFGAAAKTLEVVAWFKIPFDMWMEFAEAQQEASEYWDIVGQLVAIRQWLRELINLTVTAPFPQDLHIDIGGEEQAIDRWIAEQQAAHAMFNILTVAPFPAELKDGYARAAVTFGRIGPQVVEQADKYLNETIAESGLSPCSIKAMTDVGLFDLDALRRKVIRQFAEAVRDSVPPVL
jgi:hypothetical protein